MKINSSWLKFSFCFSLLFMSFFATPIQGQQLKTDDFQPVRQLTVCEGEPLTLQMALYTDQKLVDDFYGGDLNHAFADMVDAFRIASRIYEETLPDFLIRIEGVYLMDDPELLAIIEDINNSEHYSFATKFQSYHHATYGCPKVDAIYYFTGYELGGINGVTPNNQLCMNLGNPQNPNFGFSMSEPINTNAFSINTAAHELGHILGANHVDQTNCANQCSGSPRPLMCDGGTAADPEDFFLTNCTLDAILYRIGGVCECLIDPGPNYNCDNCLITTDIQASSQEIEIPEGCVDPEKITFEITVCNDCYPSDLEIIAYSLQPDQSTLELGDFDEITQFNGSLSDWLIMDPVSFAPEECKTFQFFATPLEPQNDFEHLEFRTRVVRAGAGIAAIEDSDEVKVKVVKTQETLVSDFRIEDASEIRRTRLCSDEEVFLNGRPSANSDRYNIKVWRAPIGSNDFTFLVSESEDGAIGRISFSNWMDLNNMPLEGGFIYRVRLTVSNNCVPGRRSTRSFVYADCCETPRFLTCSVIKGETFLTWEATSPIDEYRLYIDPTSACCGNADETSPSGIKVFGNSFSTRRIKPSCFQWQVQAICDGEDSGLSTPSCFNAFTPCFGISDLRSISNDDQENFSKEGLPNLRLSPNPATNQVKIKIDLPKASEVSIDIRGINGQIVQAFETINRSAGTYEQHWNIDANLPAGLYLVTVQTNAGRSSERLVILD